MKISATAVLLCCVSATLAAQTGSIYNMNGRIPLGIESFRLEPAGQLFYLMASVENREFVGLYRVETSRGRHQLFDSNNRRVRFYPSRVQFRLTASTREKLIDDRPFDTREKISVDDLLKKLRFRIKVFHALDYRYIQPDFVENVGMPDQVTYNERIYRIGFDLGKIPIDDRIVMEVISPNGERLCKFHLDLL